MTVVELLTSTGARRDVRGPLRWVVRSAAVAISCGVLYATVGTYIDLFAMTIAFLSAVLTLVFLTIGASATSHAERPSWIDFVLSLSALSAGIYFYIESDRIITRITLLDPLTVPDVIFSSILLVLTLEATRRTVGLGLTAIVLVFLAYNLWGHVLPGKLGHGEIGYLHFLDIMMFTTDGLFGVPVKVAATYAFLFVMFGTFLGKAG
ncbi:MAG TPA: hypothetical protein VLL72_01285, partial [Kiloniellales bacterium]|nr:hypothetical protein [Kiloniellales bacterium]